MQKVTDRDLKVLQHENLSTDLKMITDASGMSIVVRKSLAGSNTVFFKLRYKDENDKRKWFTIGKFPELSLPEARMKYSLLVDQVQAGKIPTLKSLGCLEKCRRRSMCTDNR